MKMSFLKSLGTAEKGGEKSGSKRVNEENLDACSAHRPGGLQSISKIAKTVKKGDVGGEKNKKKKKKKKKNILPSSKPL